MALAVNALDIEPITNKVCRSCVHLKGRAGNKRRRSTYFFRHLETIISSIAPRTKLDDDIVTIKLNNADGESGGAMLLKKLFCIRRYFGGDGAFWSYTGSYFWYFQRLLIYSEYCRENISTKKEDL